MVERRFSRPPILIGGCGRSGTTLVQAILGAHPQVHVLPGEVDAFTTWQEGRPLRIDRLYRGMLLHPPGKDAQRWCVKRPYMVRHIGEILNYLPQGTKFIHVVRDARAVCCSHHPKQPNTYWVAPQRYYEDVSCGLDYAQEEHVYLLKYEDLVQHPQNTIEALCEFLEVSFDQKLLRWQDHTSIQKANSWFSAAKPIHQGSLNHWKAPKYDNRVHEIINYPGMVELLKKLGYSV
ncbi:sulfotransferase family protein [Marinoscillum furvescens]|uniref:Sulfotransferase family protein n=1 Tax=Marinoscillum furvescens DSM 4134 TaxID=1122208 RepID=A0A3D9L0M3_MARFU|nr:sulfotransferase [Marinoscillum furvescens]RED94416.1 sulfotransferase family protein [Marinoscillum furvescens DSM 4134]